MVGSFVFHRVGSCLDRSQDPKKRIGASVGVLMECFSMFQVIQIHLGSSVGLIAAVFYIWLRTLDRSETCLINQALNIQAFTLLDHVHCLLEQEALI